MKTNLVGGQGPHRFRETCGEILRDSSILDLVSDGDRLLLCHWNGHQSVILPFLDRDGTVYRPPALSPSLRQALRFPAAAVEYGSLRTLFSDIVKIFENMGISKDDSRWCALVVLSTWVPELFSNLPTLLLCGSDVSQAATLFRVFACLCRRALIIAEFCRTLPFSIRPTLLILSAELSGKERAFWSVSNFKDVHIPRHGNAVDNFACPRVVFTF